MKCNNRGKSPKYGRIQTAAQLGELIRSVRKNQNATLEKVSGLTNISMRFLSELERGKQTAELGKVISAVNKIGLDIIILPRGYEQRCLKLLEEDQ